MRRFIRWCSIVCALLGVARARAGARHLSRPAGPVRRRLPAGRRDRHVLPARSPTSSRTALGQLDRDREQGRRRRLHRLADGRGARRPTATRCWWRRTRSASTRRCSRSIRRASTRSRTTTRSARWRARRWCGPSPTTCPPTTSTNSSPGRRPCRAISTTATPAPAACRTWSPRSFSTAPACRPFRCRSRAAARRRRRSPAAIVSVVVSSLPVAKAQVRRQARQGPVRDQPQALAGDAGRADAARSSAYKFADVELEFWWGLFVPKGTPEPIRAKLEKALQATMANPAVRERLAKVDTDPSFAPGPALQGQARERDQELVEVHRRQGHQGRAIGVSGMRPA